MNQLRIIAGTFGGRLINTPKNRGITHPMGDRERGALMNALGPDLQNAEILDAFAGSGAIGLEALSRGAAHVTFLEKDKKAQKTIEENIKKLDVTPRIKLAKTLVGLKPTYDIIIADPPYDNLQYPLIFKLIDRLEPGGIFVLSHPKSDEPPTFKTLQMLSDKSYAGAAIKIYHKP